MELAGTLPLHAAGSSAVQKENEMGTEIPSTSMCSNIVPSACCCCAGAAAAGAVTVVVYVRALLGLLDGLGCGFEFLSVHCQADSLCPFTLQNPQGLLQLATRSWWPVLPQSKQARWLASV